MNRALKANDNEQINGGGNMAKKKKEPSMVITSGVTLGGIGHNGEVIPELYNLMKEDLALDEQKKAISKAQRDIRNKVKQEFGVLCWNWNYEKAMRKKDSDVRVQQESGIQDLKNMLGYQRELDLLPGTIERTENQLTDPSAPKDDVVNLMR